MKLKEEVVAELGSRPMLTSLREIYEVDGLRIYFVPRKECDCLVVQRNWHNEQIYRSSGYVSFRNKLLGHAGCSNAETNNAIVNRESGCNYEALTMGCTCQCRHVSTKNIVVGLEVDTHQAIVLRYLSES